MPPTLSARSNDRLDAWLVDLDGAHEALEAAELALPRLSIEDAVRGAGFVDSRHGARWRAARIALRIAIERIGGRASRGVPFVIEAQGRPTLPGCGVVFSLAHTMTADAAHALIAVGTAGPIGCDLEGERAIAMNADRLARLRQAGGALSPPGRTTSSEIEAWVRLEALGKADGRGVWPVLDAAGVHGARALTAQDTAAGVRGLATALGVMVADVVLPAPLRGAIAAPPRVLAGPVVVPGGLDDLLVGAT